MTKIILNGREVVVDASKPLIAAIHAEGTDVPHYCYHPGLSPVGSCRICQVQVTIGEMPPRVVVACRTPVTEGMRVDTEAVGAHEARRECLEFLLKNHPLDCPICDKAGECTLQDYSFDEGQGEGRSVEPRRKLEKRKDLGDVILLDQERCILCSRCVRFFEEVPRKPQLVVSQRGAHSVIETFQDRPLSGNYQGNIADLCPVGALTLKQFRFEARVWNLNKTASTCAECSRGCAITTEVLRGKTVERFRPRYEPEVNGYWMCDTGRFAWEHANAGERVVGSALRDDGGGFAVFEVEDGIETVRDIHALREGAVVVASPFITVEEGRELLALCQAIGAQPTFVSPEANDLADDLLHTGDPCPNRKGLTDLGFEGASAAELLERLCAAPAALLVGERVAELLGAGLAEVPASVRLVALECHLVDVPAADVCIGIPNHVERAGTWVNVDGHVGMIGPARQAPSGVWRTTRVLSELTAALAGSGEGASAR